MPISVATFDIDYAGHVSNISYFRWLESMRLRLLEEHFPLQELMDEGYMPVIAASEIKYKKSIKLFDKPVGHMWIESISAATMEFRCEIKVDGMITTVAGHTGLFVSPSTMKPTRLPPKLVQKFKEWKSHV